jgi:hypothetical protein
MLTIHYDTGNFAMRLRLRANAALTFSPGASIRPQMIQCELSRIEMPRSPRPAKR